MFVDFPEEKQVLMLDVFFQLKLQNKNSSAEALVKLFSTLDVRPEQFHVISFLANPQDLNIDIVFTDGIYIFEFSSFQPISEEDGRQMQRVTLWLTDKYDLTSEWVTDADFLENPDKYIYSEGKSFDLKLSSKTKIMAFLQRRIN